MKPDELLARIQKRREVAVTLECSPVIPLDELDQLLSAASERDRFAGYIADLHGRFGRGTHGNAEQDYRCALSGLLDVLEASKENSLAQDATEAERDRLREENANLRAALIACADVIAQVDTVSGR